MGDLLENLFFDLQKDLDRVRRRFNNPDNIRLTLVVRSPDLDDGHAVIGDDDLDLVIATIYRYKELPPQFKPRSQG